MARFMASKIDDADAARAPHQDFTQLGQGVTPTDKESVD
jgi:hypothetical protein